MTFTVRKLNGALGTSNYCGVFLTEADAIAYATKESLRSQRFMSYEVWTGTPQAPLSLTGVKVTRP